jgi:hypothetical protein
MKYFTEYLWGRGLKSNSWLNKGIILKFMAGHNSLKAAQLNTVLVMLHTEKKKIKIYNNY